MIRDLRPRVATLGLLIAAVLAVLASPGSASASPYTSNGVTLSNSTPAPGGSLTVTGSGFQPGSTASILIFSTPLSLGTAAVDANGQVTATVTIPASFTAGSNHTIEVQGTSPNGSPLTESVGLTLAPAVSSGTGTAASGTAASGAAASGTASSASSSTLPFTGANIGWSIGVVIVLIGAGTALVLLVRRRRPSAG